MSKRSMSASLVAVVLTALAVASYVFAAGKTTVFADPLTGYQETSSATPGGVSSAGTGSFTAVIDEDASTITYELTYVGLSAAATVAHIHFGNRFTSGGVSVFLCGGGSKPACPPGTATEAVVTGIADISDVVGPAGQGIAPGEFAELVRAIRAGVTYVNVHNTTFPSGEIRGQINNDNQRQP